MDFIVSANTDIGIVKEANQDSLTVKVINTSQGRMVFALVCDGMGGLDKGEVASASVIRAFEGWIYTRLPILCRDGIGNDVIRAEWEALLREQNERIADYGQRKGVRLGTTAVVMLLTQEQWYVMNIGDSRAYEITDRAAQLTEDQTLLAREIALGHITPGEAETDSRRNILLQCIGASPEVHPEMYSGQTQVGAVYMLCSDGFRHEITPQEIYNAFRPEGLLDELSMRNAGARMVDLNKQRGERDNITVVLVRTF